MPPNLSGRRHRSLATAERRAHALCTPGLYERSSVHGVGARDRHRPRHHRRPWLRQLLQPPL